MKVTIDVRVLKTIKQPITPNVGLFLLIALPRSGDQLWRGHWRLGFDSVG
jgi:hypothetical protein